MSVFLSCPGFARARVFFRLHWNAFGQTLITRFVADLMKIFSWSSSFKVIDPCSKQIRSTPASQISGYKVLEQLPGTFVNRCPKVLWAFANWYACEFRCAEMAFQYPEATVSHVLCQPQAAFRL